MVERKETSLTFFVAHQQLAKAIESAMTDLHHPAPGFLVGVTLLGLFLFGATHYMRYVAVALDDF